MVHNNSTKKNPSINDLRAVCQTPESSQNDSWYGKLFGRRISIYFTKLFLYTPLSGNGITLLWCTIDLIAAYLLLFPNYWNAILASLLLQLAYVLDGTDGEVSRYRKTSSLKGEYLDRLCHNISYPAIISAITLNVFYQTNLNSYLILGLVAVIFFLLSWLVDLEYCKIHSKVKYEARTSINQKIENKYVLFIGQAIFKITGIDAIILLILILSIFNLLNYFIILYSIVLPIRWGGSVVYRIRTLNHDDRFSIRR
jgi:phosphatidylserine synthase